MDKKLLKLLAAIGTFFLNLLLINAVGKLVVPEEWGNDSTLQNIGTILMEIEATAVFVLLSVKVLKIKINIGRENLVKGIFRYGLVICIATAPEKSIAAALPHILLSFVTFMCVGVAEEVTCRGVIFGACREYFGDSKKGIYLSVFLSALVFGGVHIVNLISTPDLVIATITQVIYAAEFGVIFAVVYYRSENLLPCIILHGLFDFANYFWLCFAGNVNEALNVQNTTDTDIISAIALIALCSTFVISGLWQLRNIFKNKPAEEPANG